MAYSYPNDEGNILSEKLCLYTRLHTSHFLTIWSQSEVPSVFRKRLGVRMATHYFACSWLTTEDDVWFFSPSHCTLTKIVFWYWRVYGDLHIYHLKLMSCIRTQVCDFTCNSIREVELP
jgi:hypothetical protein